MQCNELSLQLIVPPSINHEGTAIRVAGTQEQPLWCLADVCKVLGVKDPTQSVAKWLEVLPEDEVVNILNSIQENPQSGRGRPSTIHTHYVTEPALYRILATSRASNAKPFQDWLYKEVLPSIRRHGCYPPPADSHGEQWRLPLIPEQQIRSLIVCTVVDYLQQVRLSAPIAFPVASQPPLNARDFVIRAFPDISTRDLARVISDFADICYDESGVYPPKRNAGCDRRANTAEYMYHPDQIGYLVLAVNRWLRRKCDLLTQQAIRFSEEDDDNF